MQKGIYLLILGSICSGYGGLDDAVMKSFDCSLGFVADNATGPITILANRYPNVINIGDFTQGINLQFNILSAGYPCQPFSSAGQQLQDKDPRDLRKPILNLVDQHRPRICVFENVDGHRKKGWQQMLDGMLAMNYSIAYTILAASAVGAPHRRRRLFALCYDDGKSRNIEIPTMKNQVRILLPSPRSVDGSRGPAMLKSGGGQLARGGPSLPDVVSLMPTSNAGNFNDGENTDNWLRRREANKAKGINGNGMGMPLAIAASLLPADASNNKWKLPDGTNYWPAIDRWQQITNTIAPHPNEIGPQGGVRLNAAFAEWMMGIDYVTHCNITRKQQLTAIGGGVVPLQAIAALQILKETLRIDNEI